MWITVGDLHQETAQSHMELRFLVLARREMKKKLIQFQNKMQRHNAHSLHSIYSEDLIYRKRIRQLAEEQLRLKNCIKELENKEIMYRWKSCIWTSCCPARNYNEIPKKLRIHDAKRVKSERK